MSQLRCEAGHAGVQTDPATRLAQQGGGRRSDQSVVRGAHESPAFGHLFLLVFERAVVRVLARVVAHGVWKGANKDWHPVFGPAASQAVFSGSKQRKLRRDKRLGQTQSSDRAANNDIRGQAKVEELGFIDAADTESVSSLASLQSKSPELSELEEK